MAIRTLFGSYKITKIYYFTSENTSYIWIKGGEKCLNTILCVRSSTKPLYNVAFNINTPMTSWPSPSWQSSCRVMTGRLSSVPKTTDLHYIVHPQEEPHSIVSQFGIVKESSCGTSGCRRYSPKGILLSAAQPLHQVLETTLPDHK